MDKIRKPFQGVWNIVRFNWHFYVLSFGVIIALLLCAIFTEPTYDLYLFFISFLIFLPILISLLVSYYVYDLSGLYQLDWLNDVIGLGNSTIININAGFDETSSLLHSKFPKATLIVYDFYDPKTHTEISIKRARKAYPIYPTTASVITSKLPAPNQSADKILVLFAAHEIRNLQERILFFKELKRVLRPNGEIVLTEHLRDIPNFLAYNIGFLHFYSKQTWVQVFEAAGLTIKHEQKITPFISTFTLSQYGTAS